jgi:hypothetical protein
VDVGRPASQQRAVANEFDHYDINHVHACWPKYDQSFVILFVRINTCLAVFSHDDNNPDGKEKE